MLVVTSYNPASKIHVNLETFRKGLVYLVINSNLNFKKTTFTAKKKHISTVIGNDFDCP